MTRSATRHLAHSLERVSARKFTGNDKNKRLLPAGQHFRHADPFPSHAVHPSSGASQQDSGVAYCVEVRISRATESTANYRNPLLSWQPNYKLTQTLTYSIHQC